MVLAAACGVAAFFQVALGHAPQTVPIITFLDVGSFEVSWSLRYDTLSAVMVAMVTFIATLIHIYSVGYMSHDPTTPRFFAYLSLFTFMMLMLVTADNLVQLFFGWEGVGLASYLLIGYWYEKESANAAAMKAFIVNRVGDLFFMLGLALTFWTFGSVEFETIFAGVEAARAVTFLGLPALEVIGVLLFLGACGKSAQLGLHTWLPDAMEGPTPVSALIHAATMVTAGVFLIARMSPVMEYAPFALGLVTVVGAATAIFAATIGCVQNDIKRIIAYSTCSQLGYMFFAAGVGVYQAAIFHLFTHAFFKALLFLGAGSVIHAMSDEQDIRKMGGIWRKIPITYAVMWIRCFRPKAGTARWNTPPARSATRAAGRSPRRWPRRRTDHSPPRPPRARDRPGSPPLRAPAFAIRSPRLPGRRWPSGRSPAPRPAARPRLPHPSSAPRARDPHALAWPASRGQVARLSTPHRAAMIRPHIQETDDATRHPRGPRGHADRHTDRQWRGGADHRVALP
ncbi:NADH-quinone oxidoreductase subunit L [Leptolyngbya sp. 15MV]|nr:NADH-quinone oxidoreductase subunit L [Leptolyngbya sp. 15MV]